MSQINLKIVFGYVLTAELSHLHLSSSDTYLGKLFGEELKLE